MTVWITLIISLSWHGQWMGYIKHESKNVVLRVDVIEAGKMGKCKDLSDFDKGQIVMARWLGQSISKIAALVRCSWSAVVSTYQKWSKEGKAKNRRKGHDRGTRGVKAGPCGPIQQTSYCSSNCWKSSCWFKLLYVYRMHLPAIVNSLFVRTYLANEADSYRKMSKHTVHHSLLCMG